MRVVVIGEGMIELSARGTGWQLGYGGDTLNMAIHMARLGHNVGYVSALGSDPFSDELRCAWKKEGLNTDFVLTDPARQPGIYAIRTNAVGERSFHYWRKDSAFRGLFDLSGIDQLTAWAETADLLCYSLITLAVLPPAARHILYALCAKIRRRGGRVAFDGNYREQLWGTLSEARSAHASAIACADIGLPTLEDERALLHLDNAASVMAFWEAAGTRETVVKLGVEGCRLPDGSVVPPAEALVPVDTSGAGDAFNAAYLSGRLNGSTMIDAAQLGHRLAGWVVMQRGALPAHTPDAPYCS